MNEKKPLIKLIFKSIYFEIVTEIFKGWYKTNKAQFLGNLLYTTPAVTWGRTTVCYLYKINFFLFKFEF